MASPGLTPLKYIKRIEFFYSTVSGANAGGDVRIPTVKRPFFFFTAYKHYNM